LKFADIRLTGKLTIGFGAVLAIVAITSTLIFMRVTQLAETERLNSVSSGAIDLLDQLNWHQEALKASTRKFMMTGQSEERGKVDTDIEMIAKDITGLRQTLTIDAPQFLPILDRYSVVSNNYTHKLSNTVASMVADPSLRLKALQISANSPIGGILDKMSSKLRGDISQWSDNWTRRSREAMGQVQTFVLGGLLACLAIGAAMGWTITQAIGRPLGEMTAAMRRLAAGDNTVLVPAVGRKDEIGQMAEAVQAFKAAAVEKIRLEGETAEHRQQAEVARTRNEADKAEAAKRQTMAMEGVAVGLSTLSAGELTFRLSEPFSAEYEKLREDFNAAMDRLQEVMKTVVGSTSAIRSGAGEITVAADDLSRRTEQQAASLEQTAAALDQITATVKKTAQGAIEARDAVVATKSDAERSGVVVRDAVAAMSGIEQSSRQIGNIISVIDEIAFQTNLLALNAGVEAARAGDAGRGFAVVASEVRALAQRSAEAAKEIKGLISASAQHVASGVSLVGETGKALERIVTQVTGINAVVAEIAASAQEQATGLAQVNTAINQMDQVTQQNAAMVEQSTAASHGLTQETESLARLIGQFHTGVEAPALNRPTRSQPVRSRASTPAPAMKTVGRGGAARKPAADTDGWEEF